MPDGAVRPLDARQDLDALVSLTEVAFTAELARRGSDLRGEMRPVKRVLPVIMLLGKLFGELQHIFDGFVWEEGGEIAGMVIVQKTGNDPTRWLIGTVATHPDYRRRGIARRLVHRAVLHARSHGAQVCVLQVEAGNTPAYNLYRSMGFVHYDSTTRLRLEAVPQVRAVPAEGYTLRRMRLGEWPARCDLARRATPPDVQAFLPVSEGQYRVTSLGWLVTPLLLHVQGLAARSWAADKDGRLVGWIRLLATRVQKRTHELELVLDPQHQDAVAEPLLSMALETLRRYPPASTMLSVRSAEVRLLGLLDSWGFRRLETSHWLGQRLGGG